MDHVITLGAGLTFLAYSALTAGAAHASGVTAGSLIENTAQATYNTPDGTQTVTSNTVTVKVDELLDVTVTSLDAGPVATRPGTQVLTFEVTNTGNGPEAFKLVADPAIAGNDFGATVTAIATDSNGNGIYDDGVDTVLSAPQTTAQLAADDAVTVFVILAVPGDAADADTSEVELLAEAVTGTGAPGTTFAGAGENGSNAVVGASGADDAANGRLVVAITSVDLEKSAVIADPFGGSSAVPGAIVTYTIEAHVRGSAAVDNLIVTDSFPSGTTYRPGTLALDSNALTDQPADDAGSASATGITVDLGTVAGGASHTVTFDVKIEE